jgi:hypothetical protein
MMVAIFRASRKVLWRAGAVAEHLLALFPRHRAAADRLGKKIIGYGLDLLDPLRTLNHEGDGSHPYFASFLRERRKSANIQASSDFPGKTAQAAAGPK